MNILKDVIAGLTGPVAAYFQRRAELRQARYEARLKFEQALGDRQAQLALAGLTADASWEMEFARQAASSWKDEYTLLLVSVPVFLSFIKTSFLNGPAIVAAGFGALGTTPLWYQILLSSIFGATFGIRMYRRHITDT